jgi:hypothetical protein
VYPDGIDSASRLGPMWTIRFAAPHISCVVLIVWQGWVSGRPRTESVPCGVTAGPVGWRWSVGRAGQARAQQLGIANVGGYPVVPLFVAHVRGQLRTRVGGCSQGWPQPPPHQLRRNHRVGAPHTSGGLTTYDRGMSRTTRLFRNFSRDDDRDTGRGRSVASLGLGMLMPT